MNDNSSFVRFKSFNILASLVPLTIILQENGVCPKNHQKSKKCPTYFLKHGNLFGKKLTSQDYLTQELIKDGDAMFGY